MKLLTFAKAAHCVIFKCYKVEKLLPLSPFSSPASCCTRVSIGESGGIHIGIPGLTSDTGRKSESRGCYKRSHCLQGAFFNNAA